MDFESSIKDREVPIAIDFDATYGVLLLAFGGLANQLGFPMFEFNKITRGLERVNKIYLRDPHRLWFHKGLPNIGDNIDDVAIFLRQYTTHQSTRKTVIFGNSGGGYAALLFGHILQADEVHAFAPKTFISPVKRLIHSDIPPRKGSAQILLRLFLRGHKKYFDLKKILSTSSKTKTKHHLYYSSNFRVDNLHATRIHFLPGVHLHPYPFGEHNLIKYLKESGELSRIIEKAITCTSLSDTGITS